MKKIMIMLAAVTLGLSVHAAQVNWKTGSAIKAPTEDGAFSTKNAANKTLSMYVWLVSQDTYESTEVSSIYSSYGDKLGTATASATEKGGSLGATVSTTGLDYSPTSDTPYYAIVLTIYDDGNGVTGYIGNKATAVINTAGSDVLIGDLAKNIGGSGGTAIAGWSGVGGTSDIPEPTSGILFVIGGAILALRRKQK